MNPLFDTSDIFDEDYIYFDESFNGPERTSRHAEVVCQLAGVSHGVSVLDAPCGYGRLASEFEARGAHVTGIDSSDLMITEAIARATPDGASRYIKADMRELDFSQEFDCVVCWYSSFGYFTDEDSLTTLANFRKALRSGGSLVLEVPSWSSILRRLGRSNENFVYFQHRTPDIMIDVAWLGDEPTILEVDRFMMIGSRAVRKHYRLRIFSECEMRSMLSAAGFSTIDFFDITGAPFTWRSDHMVVRAIV